MRIVGDASKEIEKRVICRNCGAELGYLPIDVGEERHYDIDGSTDIVRSITCPSCHIRIVV